MNKNTNNKLYEELFDENRMPIKCALCPTGKLKEYGHIVPKLVMRWLKSASKKKSFYFNNGKNHSVVDSIAIRFLCPGCEDRFSVYEKHFTDHHFKKYYRKKPSLPVGDQVYAFALSVAWRLVTTQTFMVKSEDVGEMFKLISSGARNFFLDKSIDSKLSVYVMRADEIEENCDAADINTSDLLYSIKHALMAHDIFDALGNFRLTPSKIPLVYFKFGVYYFVVTPMDYFEGAFFSMRSVRTGVEHRIFTVSYTPEFLAFLQWASEYKFDEVKMLPLAVSLFNRRPMGGQSSEGADPTNGLRSQ